MMEMDEMSNEITPDNDLEMTEDVIPEEELGTGKEALALEPEVRVDIPNCESAFILGNPYEVAGNMDFA